MRSLSPTQRLISRFLFGYVPTPALVLPIEFTMTRDVYAEMGGHLGNIVPLEDVLRSTPHEFRSA